MFWLKKVISFWLMPLPLCLALLLSGVLLACSNRRPRIGRLLVLTGVGLLVLFSNRFVSTHLLRPLESMYPAIPEFAAGATPGPLAGCDYVAVLGGGNSDAPGISATNRLSPSALSRLVEAVRILSVLPKARLIVSGPGEPGVPTHASVVARAAESLGIEPRRITLVETAHDTEEESQAIARIAGGRRIALVTSAWHMPRSAALFRKAGADFVPCPADFVSAAPSGIAMGWHTFGFDVESLSRSTFAVHEWIGLLWTRMRLGV